MTQDKRDWQKDMDMCKSQEGEQWYNNGHHLEEYDRITEEGCRKIAEFERECEASFVAECREALPYWLQESKIYKQSYEGTLTSWEAEKARADAAEAREQRLKEAIQKIRDDCDPADWYTGTLHKEISELLSTLYPDTTKEESK